MFCPNCGSDEQGEYCKKCGAKLKEQAIIHEQISAEETALMNEKRRKKKLIYAIVITASVLFLAAIIINLIGNAKNVIENKKEQLAVQAEIKKEQSQKEQQEKMSPEEKRNQYYYQILEEYQKAENGGIDVERKFVNVHYLKECDFTSDNPPIYAALLDLCGDNSPELIISKYDKSENIYTIIDMYGFQNDIGKQLLDEPAMGYGYTCTICQNGKIKLTDDNDENLVSISYYSLDYAGTELVLEERAFEENSLYYYSSAEKSIEQEITKTEFDQFSDLYPSFTDIKWNQLSLWQGKSQKKTQNTLSETELQIQESGSSNKKETTDISTGTEAWTDEINKFYLPLAEYQDAENNGFIASKYDYPDVNSQLFETVHGIRTLYYSFINLVGDEKTELVLSVGISAKHNSPIDEYLIVDAYSYDGTTQKKIFDSEKNISKEETQKIISEYKINPEIKWRRLAEIKNLQYTQGETLDDKLIHDETEAVDYLLEYVKSQISFDVSAQYKEMDQYGYKIEIVVITSASSQIVSYYSVSEDGKIFSYDIEEFCE